MSGNALQGYRDAEGWQYIGAATAQVRGSAVRYHLPAFLARLRFELSANWIYVRLAERTGVLSYVFRWRKKVSPSEELTEARKQAAQSQIALIGLNSRSQYPKI